MALIRERSPLCGCTVKTKPNVGKDPLNKVDLGGQMFQVEDWWQNVSGKSWMDSDGNPAAIAYAFRTGFKDNVPINNDVLYGKINGLGYMFHISELEV